MNRRDGMTHVEVLLAAVIGCVVLGAAWAFFFAAGRSGTATGRRADELQARLVVLENLSADAAAAVRLEAADERHLRISKLDAPRDVSAPVPIREVLYEFDPESGLLRRNGAVVDASRALGVAFRGASDGSVIVSLTPAGPASSAGALRLTAAVRPPDGILGAWQPTHEDS